MIFFALCLEEPNKTQYNWGTKPPFNWGTKPPNKWGPELAVDTMTS